VLTIWDTAEQIGAVRALTWQHADLDGGWVRFIAEGRKGATSDNVLPLAADTIAALQDLPRASDCVFEWPYHPSYIFRRLGRIMRRAGLPNDRMHKFHVLRKSVASYYEAAGGNATELLKHSERKVTRGYLDPRIVKVAPAIDLVFRPNAAASAGRAAGFQYREGAP
jgi:integrase